MSEVKLKPCPFCGSKAKMRHYIQLSYYYVQCLNCYGAACMCNMPEEAAEAWNRRA